MHARPCREPARSCLSPASEKVGSEQQALRTAGSTFSHYSALQLFVFCMCIFTVNIPFLIFYFCREIVVFLFLYFYLKDLQDKLVFQVFSVDDL